MDVHLENWKLKRLIKGLEAAQGNGTSMVSLIVPPGDQIALVSARLTQELGTASNIKSRVNRLSVQGAITSVLNRLKLWSKVPPNGLVIYCGTIATENNGEKKVTIDFEPSKPVNTSLYLCDNRFHTDALKHLLVEEDTFGFIILNGDGFLLGTLCGNTRTILYTENVDLPNKHGRGGQSALRFSRLRTEKIQNYLRKVAEKAAQEFLTDDKVNVAGLIFAGAAELKQRLSESSLFDPRLQAVILKIVDISYGGEQGFKEAINLSADVLSSVRFVRERDLLTKYFDNFTKDNDRSCFGVDGTLQALEAGAVQTLIVWENLDITRYQLGDGSFKHAKEFKSNDIISSVPLSEWLVEHYRDFGTTLEIVTDATEEGAKFCRGFGGLGGILRYQIDVSNENNFDELLDVDIEDYL